MTESPLALLRAVRCEAERSMVFDAWDSSSVSTRSHSRSQDQKRDNQSTSLAEISLQLRAHRLGPRNIAQHARDLDAGLRNVSAALNGVADLVTETSTASVAKRFLSACKEEFSYRTNDIKVRDSIQECLRRVQTRLHKKNAGPSGLINQLQDLAKSIKLQCFVDDIEDESDHFKYHRVTLCGVFVVIDVIISSSGVATKVNMAFTFTEQINAEMDHMLLSALQSNFSHFENICKKIARVESACQEQTDFFRLLHCLGNDLEMTHRLERSHSSLEDVLLKGHGVPLPKEELWPKLAYFVTRKSLIDLSSDETNELSYDDIVNNAHKFYRARVDVEVSDNTHQYIGAEFHSHFHTSQNEQGDFVAIRLSPLLSDPVFALYPKADSVPVPHRFVLHLEPPVPACLETAALIESISFQKDRRANYFKEDGNESLISLEELLVDQSLASDDENSILNPGLMWRPLQKVKPLQQYVFGGQLSEAIEIHRVPFDHPSQLHRILQVLRRQLLFNELFVSCFPSNRHCKVEPHDKQITIADGSRMVLEVLARAPTHIQLNFSDASSSNLSPASHESLQIALNDGIDMEVCFKKSRSTSSSSLSLLHSINTALTVSHSLPLTMRYVLLREGSDGHMETSDGNGLMLRSLSLKRNYDAMLGNDPEADSLADDGQLKRMQE